MLKLHKIIRLSHVIVYRIVFLLFYEGSWQGGVFKVTKNNPFLTFLFVLVFFPKFLDKV